MQIITIYQGASGSGEELAGMVAQSLGYRPVDREVLVEASLQQGIPEAKLTEIVQNADRGRGGRAATRAGHPDRHTPRCVN